MLSTLTRKLIKAEWKLKLVEDSKNNRNFQESKIKIIQIYKKFSIFNLLIGYLTDFLSNSGRIKKGLSIQMTNSEKLFTLIVQNFRSMMKNEQPITNKID